MANALAEDQIAEFKEIESFIKERIKVRHWS